MVSGAQRGSSFSSRWRWHLRKPWGIKGTLVSTHSKVLTQFDSPNLGPELIGRPRARNFHPTVQSPCTFLRATTVLPSFGDYLRQKKIYKPFLHGMCSERLMKVPSCLKKKPTQTLPVFLHEWAQHVVNVFTLY